jgi:hypothetical protein
MAVIPASWNRQPPIGTSSRLFAQTIFPLSTVIGQADGTRSL